MKIKGILKKMIPTKWDLIFVTAWIIVGSIWGIHDSLFFAFGWQIGCIFQMIEDFYKWIRRGIEQ